MSNFIEKCVEEILRDLNDLVTEICTVERAGRTLRWRARSLELQLREVKQRAEDEEV